MEPFQESSLLYNIAAIIVVLVLFVLILKLIKSAAKTFLILIGVVIVGYGVIRFFPAVAQPVLDFFSGSQPPSE